MSKQLETSSSTGIRKLDQVFNNQFMHIPPFMMADNVITFAPRDHSFSDHPVRTKPLSNVYDEAAYSMALERPTPEAHEIYLTGEVIERGVITPILYFITPHGVLDSDGILLGEVDERHLVNLMYKFFQNQEPHSSIG